MLINLESLVPFHAANHTKSVPFCHSYLLLAQYFMLNLVVTIFIFIFNETSSPSSLPPLVASQKFKFRNLCREKFFLCPQKKDFFFGLRAFPYKICFKTIPLNSKENLNCKFPESSRRPCCPCAFTSIYLFKFEFDAYD